MYFLYSYTIVKGPCLLCHVVRRVGSASLLLYCQNLRTFYLANCQKTSFSTIMVYKKPISCIPNVLIRWRACSLLVTYLCWYKRPLGTNTWVFSTFASSVRKQANTDNSDQTHLIIEPNDELDHLDSRILKREITPVILHFSNTVLLLKN